MTANRPHPATRTCRATTVAVATALTGVTAAGVATSAPAVAAKAPTCASRSGTVARAFGDVLWRSDGRLYGCHDGGAAISLGAWHRGDVASIGEASAAWTSRLGSGARATDRISGYRFDAAPSGRAWLTRQAAVPADASGSRRTARVVALRADSGAAVWVTASGTVGFALADADDTPTVRPLTPGDSADRDLLEELLAEDEPGVARPVVTKLRADGQALRAATVDAADARKVGRGLRVRYADDGSGDGCEAGQVVSLVVPASRSTPAVDVRWHRSLDFADSVEGC